ncbi:MAG: hypothetical protein QXJ74_01520 [Nitrososphaera sp.]
MERGKMIAISIAVIAGIVSAFAVLSASGIATDLQSFDGMNEMMEREAMQMQPPKDVTIFFESEVEVPARKQAQVVLKVLDRQTNAPMQGAEAIVGIEKGLPMTSMDMEGGMFEAEEKGEGLYAFAFTPASQGYYTIHAHVIPPGMQMHSMMENHADFVVISK